MAKKNIDKVKKEEKDNSKSTNLVLSINSEEIITKFNNKCEKTSGFNKNEVINNSFFDFMVPNRYFSQWKNIIITSLKNKDMEDFKLPILTKHGHEIMISWSSFPVKNKVGDVIDINLVGDIVTSWDDSSDSPQEPIKKIINFSPDSSHIQENKRDFEYKEVDNSSSRLNINQKVQNNKIGSFFKIFKTRKNSPDYEIKKSELDQRENDLRILEDQILNDKEEINRRIREFRLWRQKLEDLEEEIENRRHEIVKKEKSLSENISIIKTDAIEIQDDKKSNNQDDLFLGISDSAFIVQKGILKQVNNSFINLLGYSSDELIEKSYFDFILPEGFSGLEEYYLHRLRGDEINNYKTVFLTKYNDKIYVEINTKVIELDGNKAEMAIVKKIEKLDDKLKIDITNKDSNDNQNKNSDNILKENAQEKVKTEDFEDTSKENISIQNDQKDNNQKNLTKNIKEDKKE